MLEKVGGLPPPRTVNAKKLTLVIQYQKFNTEHSTTISHYGNLQTNPIKNVLISKDNFSNHEEKSIYCIRLFLIWNM